MNDVKNDITIEFYDFKIYECKANVFLNNDCCMNDFVLKKTNNKTHVYMSNKYSSNWPSINFNWQEIRQLILSEFKNKYGNFGHAKVSFYDNQYNTCSVDLEYKFLDLTVINSKVILNNNHPYIYMPDEYNKIWPYESISWIDVRDFLVKEFKRIQKKQEVVMYNPIISVHDVTMDGTALFDIEIPELEYTIHNGTIRYIDDKNININLPPDFPNLVEKNITRKSIVKKIREEYVEQISNKNVNPYTRCENDGSGPQKNKYGRILNAEGAPFAFVPNTELRPIGETLNFSNPKIVNDLLKALRNNDIGVFEIDTLALLEEFRYMTKNMIIDMFAGGYISHGWRNITVNKLANIFDRLAKYKLVNISKFMCIDDSNKNNITSEAMFQIYTLGENGNRLLSELNRNHHYNPFDVYQNGNFVKAILASNQWLTYWLSAFPNSIKNNYDTAKVVRVLGAEKSAARLYGLITCGDVTMIGEPVRRTYDFEAAYNQVNIQDKLLRLINIANFKGELSATVGYRPVEFKIIGKPIICYICEDDEHMQEIWDIINPICATHPCQEIWFTTDARLFNYSNEHKRFVKFSFEKELITININERLGLGKERDYNI